MNTNTGVFPEFVLLVISKTNEDCSEIRSLYNEAVSLEIAEELDPVRIELLTKLKKVKDIPFIQAKEHFNGDYSAIQNMYKMFDGKVLEDKDGERKYFRSLMCFDEEIIPHHLTTGLCFGVDTEGLKEKIIHDIRFFLKGLVVANLMVPQERSA